MMFTLDANIFVRDVDIRDPEHKNCHELLDRLQEQRISIICPHILLPEVAGAVRRTWQDAMRGRLAAQFVSELPNLILVDIDASLSQEATDIAADYALRGMDALYVAVARRYKATLVTLDDEIQERAGTIVTVLSPINARRLSETDVR